jgi:hypothetical protein
MIRVYREIATGEVVFHSANDGLYGAPYFELLGNVPNDLPTERIIVVGDEIRIDLTKARADKWAEVKAIRSAKLEGICATPKGVMQCDQESRTNLLGAIADAQIVGAGYSITWRMADNQFVPHTAAEIAAAGQAVAAYVSAVYARSWTIEAAIAAATTLVAIDAIAISTGWPS